MNMKTKIKIGQALESWWLPMVAGILALLLLLAAFPAHADGPATKHAHTTTMICWSEENFNAIADVLNSVPIATSVLPAGELLVITVDDNGFVVVSIVTPQDGERCYITGAVDVEWYPENFPTVVTHE